MNKELEKYYDILVYASFIIMAYYQYKSTAFENMIPFIAGGIGLFIFATQFNNKNLQPTISMPINQPYKSSSPNYTQNEQPIFPEHEWQTDDENKPHRQLKPPQQGVN